MKINIYPDWTAFFEEPVIEYCDIKSEVVEQAVLYSRNTRENNDRTPILLQQCLLLSRLCCKPIWNCFNCQGTGKKIWVRFSIQEKKLSANHLRSSEVETEILYLLCLEIIVTQIGPIFFSTNTFETITLLYHLPHSLLSSSFGRLFIFPFHLQVSSISPVHHMMKTLNIFPHTLFSFTAKVHKK